MEAARRVLVRGLVAAGGAWLCALSCQASSNCYGIPSGKRSEAKNLGRAR